MTYDEVLFTDLVPSVLPSQLDGRLSDRLNLELTLDALTRVRFILGEEPFARSMKLCEGPCTVPPSIADNAIDDRVHWSSSGESRLYRGEGWTLLVHEKRHGPAEVQISAVSARLVHWIASELQDANPQPVVDDNTVPIRFWYLNAEGPYWMRKRLHVSRWCDIARNYPRSVGSQLETLAQWGRAPGHGKLLLFHGEAGTGKTNAVQALIRAWAPWADAHYVLDPEVFFGSASYMYELLTFESGNVLPSREPRTRLVIIEDADELIRKSAKRENGQAVSRLLNVADGMIGQGFHTLFVITTNEEVGALHPAIIRPGRCLANLEFGTFTPAEAAAWLGHAGPTEPVTLAQLYALTDDAEVLHTDNPAPRAGQYL